jgi:Glycosyltransferases involved in cell wall biogenesis
MISVIVPVYNVENYLEDCLDSIAKQSYADFEVLMVDDCTPDRSGEICGKFAARDSRFILLRREKNGGLSAARNTGLREAKGEYIAFVDSDDKIEPNYLEALMASVTANRSDIAVCGVSQVLLNGRTLRKHGENRCFEREEAIEEMMYQCSFDVSAWGKLYRRQVLEGMFFTEGILYEDLDIMYLVFEKCQKISYTDDTSYFYIHRKNSILRGGFNERHFDVLKAAERIVEHYAGQGGSLYDATVRRYVYSNFTLLNMLLDSGCREKRYYRMLRNNILKYSFRLLRNKAANKSDKLGVIFVSAGITPFRIGMTIYRRLRGVANE